MPNRAAGLETDLSEQVRLGNVRGSGGLAQ